MQHLKDLIKVIDQDDLEKVKRFIDNSKYLFKGAVGVRHVDFVGHKPK